VHERGRKNRYTKTKNNGGKQLVFACMAIDAIPASFPSRPVAWPTFSRTSRLRHGNGHRQNPRTRSPFVRFSPRFRPSATTTFGRTKRFYCTLGDTRSDRFRSRQSPRSLAVSGSVVVFYHARQSIPAVGISLPSFRPDGNVTIVVHPTAVEKFLSRRAVVNCWPQVQADLFFPH